MRVYRILDDVAVAENRNMRTAFMIRLKVSYPPSPMLTVAKGP
jgi:hypothetical protein